MMLDLAQVRCFIAVAEELHFGRAAARLNMTQPPLSRQIQLLEHRLGVKLLDRSSRVVRLLPAGAVFLDEGRRLLEQSEQAAASVKRVVNGEIGTITLGFTAAAGLVVLPNLLSAYRRQFPDVNVVLQEMITSDQQEALKQGKIDIAFLRPPAERQFAMQVVHRETLVAAMPPDHPFASRESLQFGDFHRERLVMYSPYQSRYFYDLVVTFARRAGATPVFSQQLSQIHSMVALVRAGFGMAIVPETAALYGSDRLVFRPIVTTPARPVELAMAWKPKGYNPLLRFLVELAARTHY